MCGIAGFWNPSLESDPQDLLAAMCEAMAHRGPDSRGHWFGRDAGLGLAHVRLAILDLSPAGHQPMHCDQGRYVLSYNGEVYNFAEIRAELESAGLAPESGWRGNGDTEVLLAACAAWGVESALSRCIGMFALALWDRRERALTLARDRVGIKPLYYGYAGRGLVFGSELKPLMLHPDFSRSLDREALTLYLRHLYVPAPRCIFEELRQLEPGCVLRLTQEQIAGRALGEPVRWWSVAEAVERGLAHASDLATPEAAAEALEPILASAVKLRMVADVPLGAFLSGGIDSSTVTALMQAQSSRPVKTFSIGSEVEEYNEAQHAAEVARLLGTDHTELTVTDQQAREVIPLLPRMFDEPFADASQIPTYLVSQLARQEVIVSLSGDGGDELFGGYNRYLLAPRLWSRLGCLPRPLRALMAGALRNGGEAALARLNTLVRGRSRSAKRQLTFRDKLQKVTEAMAARDRTAFYRTIASYWTRPQDLVRGGADSGHLLTALPAPWDRMARDMDFARFMMAADQVTYLPGDILTKVDRASMAVALEARVPILDHRVVEFAWTLPGSALLENGLGKAVLRRVLARHVPPETFERPKQGFSVPLDRWLRGPLRAWAEELLDEKAMRSQGFLEPGPIRKAWRTHLSGRRNMQHHVWAVLMFQAWAREHRPV